jgi:glycosyltransferase involved in cell wall biosynthesis
MLNTIRYMFKIRNNGFSPDIVHANIYTAGVASAIFGKLTGTKVILTEHWSGYARNLLSGLETVKAKLALNNADMILPVTQVLKQSIEDFGIKGRFRIVPNAVDTKLFKLEASNQIPSDPDSIKRILIVAEQLPVKGIPNALEALKQIEQKRADFFVNIFGDGEYRSDYENLAKTYGLENYVKFHGVQPKTTIARYMQESDFFVLPSWYENLPCVLIEALSCGLPVIASRVGGIPTLISKSTGILVEPGNVTELAGAIELMLDNCKSYSKKYMSDYANANFSSEVIGRDLDDIYHELVEMSGNK